MASALFSHHKKAPEPREGMPAVKLNRKSFTNRFLSQFQDPAFNELSSELTHVAAVAWDSYANSRKGPVTRQAGPGFADPDYDLAVD